VNRYKLTIDMAENQFRQFLKEAAPVLGKFEVSVYEVDVDDTSGPKLSVAPKPRKPRRTKAQIAADEAAQTIRSPEERMPPPVATDANQRAFPWKDAAMNTPTEAA
jgi:hypothetical protein